MLLEKKYPELRKLLKAEGWDEEKIKAIFYALDKGHFSVPPSYADFDYRELWLSPYYWWYECLRLNESYKELCFNPKMARKNQIYKDFGNIHKHDSHNYDTFKEWWEEDERGVRLFGEDPEKKTHIQIIESSITKNDIEREGNLYLKVPLQLSKRQLKQMFSNVIDLYHKGKPGHHTRISSAKYPLISNFNPIQISETVEMYEFNMVRGDGHYPLWKLAKDMRIGFGKEEREDDDIPTDVKKRMATYAYKRLERAKILIDNAGRGRFPDRNDNRHLGKYF